MWFRGGREGKVAGMIGRYGGNGLALLLKRPFVELCKELGRRMMMSLGVWCAEGFRRGCSARGMEHAREQSRVSTFQGPNEMCSARPKAHTVYVVTVRSVG